MNFMRYWAGRLAGPVPALDPPTIAADAADIKDAAVQLTAAADLVKGKLGGVPAAVVRGFAETNRLNSIRVRSGLSSRLDLIDNDVRLLDAELTAANLSIDALTARAQLAVALGGGFDPVQDIRP